MAESYLDALTKGDVPTVRRLLQNKKVDPNKIEDGVVPTPIFIALITQNLSMLQLLLCHQANAAKPVKQRLNSEKDVGMFGSMEKDIYPIQKAVELNNVDMVHMLLSARKGADPMQCARGLQGFLVFASKNGVESLIRLAKQAEDDGDGFDRLNWQEALHVAILREDIASTALIIRLGANVNQENNALLPLTLAATTKNFFMCEALLQCGADLHGNHKVGQFMPGIKITPLSCAITAGHDQAVETLIALGADVNCKLNWSLPGLDAGCSLLHIAVQKHNIAITDLLLKAGARVNISDDLGNTPLHVAAADTKDTDMLSFLLNHPSLKKSETKGKEDRGKPSKDRRKYNKKYIEKLEVNAKNKRGETAMAQAITSKNQPAVKVLVDHGCNINEFDNRRYTQLHHAAQWGNDTVCMLLLEAGADVDAGHDQYACTPLQVACEHGNYTVVNILLEFGANSKVLTKAHQTLLHLAAGTKDSAVLDELLDRGLQIDAMSNNNETPLMIAARKGSLDCLQMLLQRGADMNIQSPPTGETALHIAVYFGYDESACLLIKEGADVTVLDRRGNDPLHWAVNNCRFECLVMLLLASPPQILSTFISKHLTSRPMKQTDFNSWSVEQVSQPRSLKDSCRYSIRHRLASNNSGKAISSLDDKLRGSLPASVVDYIMYQGQYAQSMPQFKEQFNNYPSVCESDWEAEEDWG